MVWHPAEPGTGIKAGYFPSLASVADDFVESGEVKRRQVFGLPLFAQKANWMLLS